MSMPIMSKSVPEPPISSSPDECAPVTRTLVDFSAYNLPEYADRYALVIDNLFTAEDCQHLLSFVPATDSWPVASLDDVVTDTSFRNSSRIIVRDDPDLSSWILSKVRPYLHDINTIDVHLHRRLHRARIKHPQPQAEPRPGTATISRLRELRFLRYEPGHFFRRHGDGTYISEDEKEISYYTLQLYLNGDAQSLKGGATRFWHNPRLHKGPREEDYVDVKPRMGRVLVFAQDGLIHSGEVTAGVKYSIRTDVIYKEDITESTEPTTM